MESSVLHASLNKNGLSKFLLGEYTVCAVVKTDSPNFYKPPTRFAEVKTDSLIYYKPPTSFTDVKTDSLNFYKPPTRCMEVKTYSPNVGEPLTRFAVVKTDSQLLQASYTLYGGQNGVKHPIHASFNKNGLSELLLVYYTLCRGQNQETDSGGKWINLIRLACPCDGLLINIIIIIIHLCITVNKFHRVFRIWIFL